MPLAIPAIGAAVAAILAILILWATGTFAKAVAGLVPSDIPIIGRLHNIILAIGDVAIAALQWIMADVIGPMFSFIMKPVFMIVQFLESVQLLARTAATSWSWLLNSALPAIISKLERYAYTLVKAAKAYALNLYHSAVKYAHDLVVAARTYAASLYHAAVKYAHDLVLAARTYAYDLVKIERAARVAAVAGAETYARGLVNVVRTDLGAAVKTLDNEIKAITSVALTDVTKAVAVGVTTAEAYADTAVSSALGILTTDVENAVQAVFDGLIIDVGALQDVIATDLPDIRALVDAIPTSLPVSIAGDIALSVAVSRVAIRYMERCGIPNCRNLSKIGRDLQELFGVLEGAGFLGLIAYMVSDPEGAAREAQSVLEPVASGLVSAARELIGV